MAFASYARNLVPGGTNGMVDLFVHNRLTTLLEGPHGTATCADGVDNDNDGTADALDADCALPPPPLMCNGQTGTDIHLGGCETLLNTP